MADGGSGAEAQIDALYGLPLEEFTPARNQLAQELRRARRRVSCAEQVKRLRKPSVAAWTLNQLRRRHPELVDGLLEAGLRLREAQERLLAEGERGRLRDSVRRRSVSSSRRRSRPPRPCCGEAGAHGQRAAAQQAVGDDACRRRWIPSWARRSGAAACCEDRQISDLGLIAGAGFFGSRHLHPPLGPSPRRRSRPQAISAG